MRQFQRFGHEVVFLIGDFTGLIGDPTGKSETRPPLTRDEVNENAKTYARQVFKVLEKDKTVVDYNSRWMDEFKPQDFIRLAAHYTVARMLERDDFEKRYKSNQPICVHEFLYPLVQGYDSVALKADVELGGTDQKFNLLVGRDLQKSYGQRPQCVMTVPLLEGLDGVQKMSKSYDNYIAIEDTPTDMFGKTMRLSDELMLRYYELLTDITLDELAKLRSDIASGKIHPKECKMSLAENFVCQFHSADAAKSARAEFDRVFANKGLPDEVASFDFEIDASESDVAVAKVLSTLGLCESMSEVRRLIQGRGLELDGAKIEDPHFKLKKTEVKPYLFKIGKKKFAKIRVVSGRNV